MTFAKGYMSVVCQHFQRASPMRLPCHNAISFKFHMQPSSKGGKKKVYIFGLRHMTKIASMPIYGKSLKKVFFSRTTGQITLQPVGVSP